MAARFDVVISRHSHQPKIEILDVAVYLNPGSAGPRRFRLPVTLAVVNLTFDVVRPKIRDLVL